MNYGQSHRYLFKSLSRRSSTRVAKTLLGATLALGLRVVQVGASPNSWTDIMLSGELSIVSNNRYVHCIAASRGLLYMLRTESSYTALLSIDPASSVCTRLNAAAGVTRGTPFAKYGGSGVDAWDGKLYVFGGVVGVIDGIVIYSNDLHEFNPATRAGQQLDSAAGVTGSAPSVRYDVGIAASNCSLFVTFGYGNPAWPEDTFRFEISTKTWSELPSLNCYGLQEHGHTVLCDTSYVFGGQRAGGPENTLFALQVSDPAAQWTTVAVQGDGLVGRERPALVTVSAKLVLFGGTACDGNGEKHVLNDLHLYRPHANTWAQVNNAAGQATL